VANQFFSLLQQVGASTGMPGQAAFPVQSTKEGPAFKKVNVSTGESSQGFSSEADSGIPGIHDGVEPRLSEGELCEKRLMNRMTRDK
jgi:hypothetical protein